MYPLFVRFFVTPSDSVAIIAANAVEAIPYFSAGLKGVARFLSFKPLSLNFISSVCLNTKKHIYQCAFVCHAVMPGLYLHMLGNYILVII